MMQSTIALAFVASVDALCCYEGCGKAPTSCNPAGEYCSTESTCGSCGGSWCPEGPTPTPSPPTPGPSPTPPPPGPIPEGLTLYCPTESDLNAEYGNIQFHDGGWTLTGDARVSTKTKFNLVGGYVEYDMDLSGVHPGVNTNIYTISPDGEFCGKDCYCDIQDNGSPQCMELDIIEANGNCKFASTWHTIHNGFAGGGCDEGGCAYDGDLPSSSFHMKSTWETDGMWLTYMNDQPLYVNNYLADALSDNDKAIVRDTMASKGGVLESSQWVGWVPGEGCPEGGDLDSSVFTLTNLRILGKVLSGPEPTKCDPTPEPTPEPTPAPSPTPVPSECPGGSLAACVGQCPSDAALFAVCVQTCSDRCPGMTALV